MTETAAISLKISLPGRYFCYILETFQYMTYTVAKTWRHFITLVRLLIYNPSLCYKLQTPSVGLEPATCLSKARIPYPYRFTLVTIPGEKTESVTANWGQPYGVEDHLQRVLQSPLSSDWQGLILLYLLKQMTHHIRSRNTVLPSIRAISHCY